MLLLEGTQAKTGLILTAILLPPQILPSHLLLKAVNEVLVRCRDDGGAAEEHLLQRIRKLPVKLHKVSYLSLVLLIEAFVEDRLGCDDTGALDALIVLKLLLLEF